MLAALEPGLDLTTVDELLTTTRSIRRRLDLERPVDPALIESCLEVAVHAPSAENQQAWRWVVVTDADKRAAIADAYRRAWLVHRAGASGRVRRRGRARADERNIESVAWLAQHLHRVPVHVIPCVLGRPPAPGSWGNRNDPSLDHMSNVIFYGSILPAVWSLQLALRSRGLGSVLTCMHLPFADEVGRLLGIPRAVTQICLLPVAHIRGDVIRPSRRTPARDRTAWNEWERARSAPREEREHERHV